MCVCGRSAVWPGVHGHMVCVRLCGVRVRVGVGWGGGQNKRHVLRIKMGLENLLLKIENESREGKGQWLRTIASRFH